ncbi:uncharacterized protein BHQ10_002120 [Talaromyces amestolkiae]|uniref:Saccharopine dehydrogenase NADP binding domain-containing protein n=1 Tax=Talaromyces amestolkiae TaxID=1196081 RepID=A0A364KRD2_TALAM|nr:uncharacterized protein BHQ10_002120 [Talaromyces amestolkiae]RAO66108.1 hypothetical protein BHQ10_002120 [Talaromyces amestolkiae]
MYSKKHGRQYDIIVLGATGYSGHMTAEHITINLPSSLKWAVAGRSADKLKQLVSRCKDLNPHRIQPAIEICNLNNEEISVLANKTFCLITTVGPYALHGECAFKACAEAGTHYIDCTPEVPWTLEMIKKYEATAKASGAWMIPQCAMESAPSDILTWAVAEEVKSKFSSQVGDVVMDLHQLTSVPSGGTLATILNLFSQYPLKTLLQSIEPYALSPEPNNHPLPKRSFWSSLTGVYKVPGLPLLSTSISGKANEAIVFRTWGLLKQDPNLQKEFYGPKFTYREFMYAPGFVRGMLMHYFIVIGGYLLLLAPVRTLVRRFVFKPGDGPDTKKAKDEVIELQAVGKPVPTTEENKQVLGKLRYHGSMYYLTATFLAEAAATMLEEDESVRLTGGIYTPACLGERRKINNMARAISPPQPIHSDQQPSSSDTDTYTIDIINLNNLLARLEQNIFLSSSAGRQLSQQSHLECVRIGANIDYAQTLIKKIERSLPAVKAPAIRHERTTDLTKKRGRYEKVKERFDWIKEDVERSADREEEDVQEADEEDDIWEGLAPVENGAAAAAELESNNLILSEETTTIRQRRSDKTSIAPATTSIAAAMASGTSSSTFLAPKPTPATTAPPIDTKETALATHRSEQESLTTSLLTLASQLKSSSEAFQTSLENEKGILNRAVEGLDKNMTGMEAAGKRMGVLRRMTEGRGWWGRMMMYAWIFGLWIVALAIVYLGPKLRF